MINLVHSLLLSSVTTLKSIPLLAITNLDLALGAMVGAGDAGNGSW